MSTTFFRRVQHVPLCFPRAIYCKDAHAARLHAYVHPGIPNHMTKRRLTQTNTCAQPSQVIQDPECDTSRQYKTAYSRNPDPLLLPSSSILSKRSPLLKYLNCATMSTTAAPAGDADQYRLPTNVKPTHYDVTIKTDLEKLSFQGFVKIKWVFHHTLHKIQTHILEASMSRRTPRRLCLTLPTWTSAKRKT